MIRDFEWSLDEALRMDRQDVYMTPRSPPRVPLSWRQKLGLGREREGQQHGQY